MFRQPPNGNPLEPLQTTCPVSDRPPGSSSEAPSVHPSAPQINHPPSLRRGESSNRPADGSVPRCYLCPISGEVMREPVVLVESSRTFERTSITKWLEQGNRLCPVSDIPLLHCALIPNLALKDAIALYTQQTGIQLPPIPSTESEVDYISILLEDQLKAMYKGWDVHEDQEPHQQDASVDDVTLEHLTRLLSSSDRATHQSAALSLARACWGSEKCQTVVGNSKQSVEGTLMRLVMLLRGEMEEGRAGHVGWALAEVIREHRRNQLFRVRDVDVLGMLVSMLKSSDDQWVARGARIVGAWSASNTNIQNLMSESGIIPLLIDRLRTGSSIQQLHSGMALLHIAFQNHLTSMHLLKHGALLLIPSLLTSRALIVRVVAAGIIAHLLALFNYTWGTHTRLCNALVDLLNQSEDYASIVAAAAIFRLVRRDKIDFHRLIELPIIPRILDLMIHTVYPSFRRSTHYFLLQWANGIKASPGGTHKLCREVIDRLIEGMELNVAGISVLAVDVIWILLPLHRHYRSVMGRLERFEKLSMESTAGDEMRSKCRDVVMYCRRVDMEQKTRIQVFLTTLGVCGMLKIVKMLKWGRE